MNSKLKLKKQIICKLDSAKKKSSDEGAKNRTTTFTELTTSVIAGN